MIKAWFSNREANNYIFIYLSKVRAHSHKILRYIRVNKLGDYIGCNSSFLKVHREKEREGGTLISILIYLLQCGYKQLWILCHKKGQWRGCERMHLHYQFLSCLLKKTIFAYKINIIVKCKKKRRQPDVHVFMYPVKLDLHFIAYLWKNVHVYSL